MPLGTYKNVLQFTEQQRENDSIHGILENSSRSIDFTADTFKYTFHFYYQYENSYYVMVEQRYNDTVFSGTYITEEGKVIATVTNGEQKARDQVKGEDFGVPGNIVGRLVFSEEGEILKMIECQLFPENLSMMPSIVSPNLVFKRQE